VNFRVVVNGIGTRAISSSGFGQKNSLLTGLCIREVKNLILSIRIPDDISNDSINSRCSVGYIYHRGKWGIENLC
jgi:hypothetical protein